MKATSEDAARGLYWPNADEELLLRAALLDPPEALEAWRALPWVWGDTLGRSAYRMLPLLATNLQRHGVEAEALAPFLEVRDEVAARNAGLFTAIRGLLGALANEGIATMVLKGAALAMAHYRDPGLRHMADVDVLVPMRQAEAAVEALGKAGWNPKYVGVTSASLEVQHARPFVDADRRNCDLHWHVYWEDCRPGADDELWAASVPLDFQGVPTRMLGPADQLLHLCVHGSRPVRRPGIQWAADAFLVIRAGGVDWSRLVEQATDRNFVLRTRAMLAYLARALGAPVPADVLARLEAAPVALGQRLEFYAGNHGDGLLGQLPTYWAKYRRTHAGASPLAFARFLQQSWEMGSLAEVAGGVLSRARKRLGSVLRAAGR